MEKQWWQYIDKPAYLLLFGGIFLLSRHPMLGGTLAITGAIATVVYFFMQQKNS